jgi:hypothetical protein
VWYASAASVLRVEMGDDSFQVVWIQAEEQPLERVLNPLL